MDYSFRKATLNEVPQIWDIIQKAIIRRKKDGSDQWQDGYPNPDVIKKDIQNDHGYVLTAENDQIIGYTAVLFNEEPAYKDIKGRWLTNEDFVVLHRLAISEQALGKGLAQKILFFIEELALKNNIFSIKVDTNFDNLPMLKIFDKLGYIYCGEVSFRGGVRKAYEKVLKAISKTDN
jgi:GNAT superfamily N-acetyltransferase